MPDIEPEEDAYSAISTPKWVSICPTHKKEVWFKHEPYFDNKDGTISCPLCGWGTKLPGYMKLVDGKIVDQRVNVGS